MKVLVVEDSPVVLERLLALLALSGRYEGIGCRNGGDALELADACRPAALLLDVRLDAGNGLALLERLRGRGLTAPVVMLADDDGRQYHACAAAQGADALLCKPTQFEEIVPTLDRLMDEYRFIA